MSVSRAVRSEDRDPILGLWPRRALTIARGRRKGPPRAPRPLTRAAAFPAARPRLAAAPLRFGREAPQRPAVQQ
ncbi:hypothetical protein NDU88_004592 [Pleurodeles waltl]|uniref:Uncharacterized protein n=1 Tax=Pleurodeles waltl TaxID=8319 RepID=A0AAV7WSE5_PLEWA|nr:hypothetical protein NDU88_004592 [Pleurodeles waltl]